MRVGLIGLGRMDANAHYRDYQGRGLLLVDWKIGFFDARAGHFVKMVHNGNEY